MNDIKSQLKEIVNINTDSYKGYETAAEKLSDTNIQTMLNKFAQQRKSFIQELENDIRSYGIVLDPSSTYAGFFHRAWLSTKATFSTNTIESVIDTSVTGEQKAVEVYTSILKEEDIPGNLKQKLNNQLSQIKNSIHQLNQVEELA